MNTLKNVSELDHPDTLNSVPLLRTDLRQIDCGSPDFP